MLLFFLVELTQIMKYERRYVGGFVGDISTTARRGQVLMCDCDTSRHEKNGVGDLALRRRVNGRSREGVEERCACREW